MSNTIRFETGVKYRCGIQKRAPFGGWSKTVALCIGRENGTITFSINERDENIKTTTYVVIGQTGLEIYAAERADYCSDNFSFFCKATNEILT